jgi:hypothetical protein
VSIRNSTDDSPGNWTLGFNELNFSTSKQNIQCENIQHETLMNRYATFVRILFNILGSTVAQQSPFLCLSCRKPQTLPAHACAFRNPQNTKSRGLRSGGREIHSIGPLLPIPWWETCQRANGELLLRNAEALLLSPVPGSFLLLRTMRLLLTSFRHKPSFLLAGNKNYSEREATDTEPQFPGIILPKVCFSMGESLSSLQYWRL